jgi:hypothetical protein
MHVHEPNMSPTDLMNLWGYRSQMTDQAEFHCEISVRGAPNYMRVALTIVKRLGHRRTRSSH